MEIHLDTILTSALNGGEWSAVHAGLFTPGEGALQYLLQRWGGGGVWTPEPEAVRKKNKLFFFPVIELRFLSSSVRRAGAIPIDYIRVDIPVCLVLQSTFCMHYLFYSYLLQFSPLILLYSPGILMSQMFCVMHVFFS
jgi:hypothetical protein